MPVILNPDWTFEQLVKAAWKTYSSPIQFSGYRINTIKTWGNFVGRSVALHRFNEYLAEHATKKKAAEYAGMSYSTLRGIELFYKGLPDDFLIIRIPFKTIQLAQELDIEEDVHNEFKSINSRNPVRSICDSFTKYAIGFLNADGGRVFWGIQDVKALVEGVKLSTSERDKVRIGIQNKINHIQPKVDPTSFKINFIKVNGAEPDIFVILVEIPKANTGKIYFSESGKCWVRVNGATQIINGPAIQELILGKQKYYS